MSPRQALARRRRQRGSLLFYVLSILPMVVLGPIVYEQQAGLAIRKAEQRIITDQVRLRLERRALFAQTLLLRGETYPGIECDETTCLLTLSEDATGQRGPGNFVLTVSYAVQDGYGMRSEFRSGVAPSVGIPASTAAQPRSVPVSPEPPSDLTELGARRMAWFSRVWAGMLLLQGLVIGAFFVKDRKLRSSLPFS